MDLREFTKGVYENAKDHGWHETKRDLPEVIALCHSELSEALEEHRDGKPMIYTENGKPEGVAVEMADCIIRILDWFGSECIDVEEILVMKHEFNKTRPYKHGKKL